MSDISGPEMYPGFEKYITGYPLKPVDMYVLAKTWYAPEMKRPGCVWTHSLLIERKDLETLEDATDLTEVFQRPRVEDMVELNADPIAVTIGDRHNALDRVPATLGWLPSVVESVYGEDSVATSLLAKSAVEHEMAVLRLWLQGWGAVRSTFCFCTGSLSVRQFHDAPLDFQVIPKQIEGAVLRTLRQKTKVYIESEPTDKETGEAWVDVLVQDILMPGGNSGRSWLNRVAATEGSRSLMGPLLRVHESIYRDRPPEPAQAVEKLQCELSKTSIGSETLGALLGGLFDLYVSDAGYSRSMDLLKCLSVDASITVFDSIRGKVVSQAARIFDKQPISIYKFIEQIFGENLSTIGEELLLQAIGKMETDHTFGLFEAHPELIPLILRRKPGLAAIEGLWTMPSIDRRAVIAAVIEGDSLNSAKVLATIARQLFTNNIDDVAHELLEWGGEDVIASIIEAYRTATDPMPSGWRFELLRRAEEVITYLSSEPTRNQRDLLLLTEIVNPNDSAVSSNCARMYESFLHYRDESDVTEPAVAAFGMALAFGGSNQLMFVVASFQTVHDSLESVTLPSYAWSWLTKHAPAVSWWREWDKCERITVAVTRKIQEEGADAEVFLRTIRSRTAIKHALHFLMQSKSGRNYLKEIRKTLQRISGLGTSEQHSILGQ